jgi:hypothetical protein
LRRNLVTPTQIEVIILANGFWFSDGKSEVSRRRARMRKALALLLVMSFSLPLVACSVRGNVSLDTYVVPLSISIDSAGKITLTVKTGIKIPTPIGVVSAGIVIDPSEKYDVPNTLIVRMNGNDHIFDLHGQDFRLEVASGYYEAVYLQKTGKNLLLELERSRDGMPNAITIPLFRHERYEGDVGYATMTIEKIVLTDKEAVVYIDAKSHIWSNYDGPTEQVRLVDSCLNEVYRKPIDLLGIAMPGIAEEQDYGPLRAEATIETRDHEKGYVVFSRGILREDASYRFCFGCEHRMCSEPLPLR